MNSRRRMSAIKSGNTILAAQTSTLIEAETGIKTITAVHSQCRLGQKRTNHPGQKRPMSAMPPIATEMARRHECPLSANKRHTAIVLK